MMADRHCLVTVDVAGGVREGGNGVSGRAGGIRLWAAADLWSAATGTCCLHWSLPVERGDIMDLMCSSERVGLDQRSYSTPGSVTTWFGWVTFCRSTQPFAPLGWVNRVMVYLAVHGVFTCVESQVTLCDPILQVTLHSSEIKLHAIFRSGTDLISLIFFLFLRRPLQKSLRLRRFRLDRDEIWQDCS